MVIIACVINVGLRLSWIPLIPNYLYQSVAFDIIAMACMIIFLVWNGWSLHQYSLEFSHRHRGLSELIIFIFNSAILFGVAELLINIKTILLFIA